MSIQDNDPRQKAVPEEDKQDEKPATNHIQEYLRSLKEEEAKSKPESKAKKMSDGQPSTDEDALVEEHTSSKKEFDEKVSLASTEGDDEKDTHSTSEQSEAHKTTNLAAIRPDKKAATDISAEQASEVDETAQIKESTKSTSEKAEEVSLATDVEDNGSEKSSDAEETSLPQAVKKDREAKSEKKEEPKSDTDSPTDTSSIIAEGSDDDSDGAHEEEDDDHDEEVDISTLSKEDILSKMRELAARPDWMKQIKTVRQLKDNYQLILHDEEEAALTEFLKSGGEKDGFEYKGSEDDSVFFGLFREYMRAHKEQRHSLDAQRNVNLATKKRLIEELRALVDSDETEGSINKFKKIQKEWREAGMVPATEVKELWASYQALVDRFYNNQRIFIDLIDLDRKKNLESKLELIERAEKLMDVTIIKDAIKELNDIHEEFKHIGPVPREQQEELWQKLKAASDRLHDKRKDFLDNRHVELNQNLEEKQELLIKLIDTIQKGEHNSPKHWIKKTDEVLALREEWKKTGPVPSKKFEELNKNFWSTYKTFFAAKNNFFKEMDREKSQNLALKTDMCERVEEWFDADDWDTKTEDIKVLQQEWKTIGPVPGKHRESIYVRFKKACDAHFEKKRRRHQDRKDEENENLTHKKQIIDEIKVIPVDDADIKSKLESLREKFAAVGDVPYNERSHIQGEFSKAIEKVIGKSDAIDENEKDALAIQIEVGSTEDEGELRRMMERKEVHVRRRISEKESDIGTLKVNLEFFGRSKKANQMKEQYEKQVADAEAEIANLKDQLRKIRKSM